MIPSWILDIFAAIMLVVAAVSAARLVAARPWQHRTRPAALADIDVAHLLMAIAMAGTLAPGLRTLPDAAWEVIFGVMTAWFAYRVARDARVSGFRALAGRPLRAAPAPRRGHAVHVRRRVRPRGTRIGRHGRDGRRRGRDGDPGPAVPGAAVRAGADRVLHLGPGPDLRPRHQRALQPHGRPRGVARPGAGRGRGDRSRGQGGQRAPRPRPRCRSRSRPGTLRRRRPAARRTAPASSPRGWRPAAGSRWASPWRSCW